MTNPFRESEPEFSKEFPGQPDGEPFIVELNKARSSSDFQRELLLAHQMLYLFRREPARLTAVARAWEKLGKLDRTIAYYKEALNLYLSYERTSDEGSIAWIRREIEQLQWMLDRDSTKPLRLYIDMDDVLCDYMGAHERELASAPDNPYPQSRPGFYLDLTPFEGAVEAMKWIEAHSLLDPFILTAPSVFNPHSYTEKRLWAEKHLGFDWCNRLILSPNKSIFESGVLIDDRREGHGQDKFNGRLLQFGTVGIRNWNTLTKYLKNYVE